MNKKKLLISGLALSIALGAAASVSADTEKKSIPATKITKSATYSADSFENQKKYFKDDLSEETIAEAKVIYNEYTALRQAEDHTAANAKWKEYMALDLFAPVNMVALKPASEGSFQGETPSNIAMVPLQKASSKDAIPMMKIEKSSMEAKSNKSLFTKIKEIFKVKSSKLVPATPVNTAE